MLGGLHSFRGNRSGQVGKQRKQSWHGSPHWPCVSSSELSLSYMHSSPIGTKRKEHEREDMSMANAFPMSEPIKFTEVSAWHDYL